MAFTATTGILSSPHRRRRAIASIGGGTHACLTALALSLLALLFFAVPQAHADADFCPPGSGAGQCASPPPTELNTLRGLAVDNETHRLYVADRNNNRIDVFEENGTFLFAFGWGVDTGAPELQKCTAASTCQAGIAGAGAGQIDHAGRIAVDNDPTSPSQHAVYVAEDKNHRVQKFGPEGELLGSIGGTEGEAEGQLTTNIFAGVGPGGVLYVLDAPRIGNENRFKQRLQRFKPDGEEIASQCFALEGGDVTGFAVEAGGDFWVSTVNTAQGIRKYDSACAPLVGPLEPDIFPGDLAFNVAGELFSTQVENRNKGVLNPYSVITAYDASGAIQRRYAYDRIPNPEGFRPEGLAVGPAGVFLSLGHAAEVGVRRLEFSPSQLYLPPPGPIVAPSSVEATKVGGAKATVLAETNPEGKATQIHVEYLTQADYEAQGNSFSGLATKSTPTEPLGAEGFRLKSREFPIGCPDPASESNLPGNTCLQSETKYRFRVVATNPDGAGEGTVEGVFETKPSPEFDATYATAVGTDTARLEAEVNPQEHPTTGYFEYVDDAHFQASGFAEASKVPDVDAGEAPLAFGAGEEFATRSIAAYPLAPGTLYHYRLVASNPSRSEPARGGEETLRTYQLPSSAPCPANEASRIGPGALLPDCRAYELVSPLDKGGADIRVLQTNRQSPAVLEQSALSGNRLAFGSLRAFGDAASAPLTSQYIANRVAGEEWQTHSIDSPRGRSFEGPLSQADTEFKFFSPELCDAWQITYAEPPLGEGALAGLPNLYRRTDRLCGPEGYEALAPTSKPLGIPAGQFEMELQGVSADGTHAIFRSNGKLGSVGTGGQRQLYESVRGGPPRMVCLVPPAEKPVSGACTAGSSLQIDTRSTNATGAISEDGQRIYWSAAGEDEGKLYVRVDGTHSVNVSKAAEAQVGRENSSFFWGAAADGARAVFIAAPSQAVVNDFSSDLYEFTLEGESTQLIAEGVLGVMGMSKDAQRIYFASEKELAPGAVAGKPNLYLFEAGEGGGTTFIATLADGDIPPHPQFESSFTPEPRLRTARVSPDGTYAAFASLASLTGYDNHDAATGEADREVYLYDADTGKLRCASCNPSEARPTGAVVAPNARFAARIPGFETSMHAANVLSDDGTRLYFESADPLSARDSNGAVDVYQWEAPGAGTCTPAAATYSPSDEGCVDLISSGQSSVDSRFVEATPDGHDAFFATLSSLLPQDPGLIDVYDARENGGLPIPQGLPSSCEGEACQGPSSPPNDPTPASSAFHGSGNVTEAGAARARCKKGARAPGQPGKRVRTRTAPRKGKRPAKHCRARGHEQAGADRGTSK